MYEEQLEADSDDGYARQQTSAWVDTTINVANGDLNGFMDGGYRFPTVEVPAGATVLVAYVIVEARITSTDGAGVEIAIHCEDEDDPVDVTSFADMGARVRTSNSTNWDGEDFVVDTPTNSPDITAVIQEILDRSGWNSGQAMHIIFDNRNSTAGFYYDLHSYDGDADRAMKLHVEYTG